VSSRNGSRPTFSWPEKKFSARKTFSFSQRVIIGVALCVATPILVWGMGFSNYGNMAVVVTVVMFVVVFLDKGRLCLRGGDSAILSFTQEEINSLDEDVLPLYTMLVPLHKEVAMLEQIIRRIEMLDWPADRKEVTLLLEWNDAEMIKASERIKLPPGFRFETVPKGKVQTKPNALNYGLSLATGDLLTIYDAEDRPDPYQLKKAYLGFQRAGEKVVCLQSVLDFHNSGTNLLTVFFAAEYASHYRMLLPGLVKSSSVVPLGGTSNHFRMKFIREVGGWDAYNVTEDAALGVDITMAGYKVGLIDSTTWEEANSRLGNWIRQRSRWIKGYMQTYLVYMRNPWTLIRKLGWSNFLTFQLVFGLIPLTMVVNPIFWGMTIVYFVTGSSAIQSLYPTPVFYLAIMSMLPGNLFFVYVILTGCMLRAASGDKNSQGQVIWMLLAPLYWWLMSVAAWKGLWQLITRPHHWEKTNHGLIEAKLQARKIRSISPVPSPRMVPEMNSDIG